MMGGKGMGHLMEQARQMQARMAKIQAELGNKTVQASAGGGMITATVNGRQELTAIRIDKAVVNPDDVEMLQDLVVAAVGQALKQSQEMAQQEMSKVTGGMNIPGLF